MSFEQKEGFGALFKNEKKDSDRHPDYQGSVKIGGVEYRLAAWIKDGKKGKFMSLKAEPPRDQQKDYQRGYEAQQPFDDDTDSIPF